MHQQHHRFVKMFDSCVGGNPISAISSVLPAGVLYLHNLIVKPEGTTDAISIVYQLQKKYLANNKEL